MNRILVVEDESKLREVIRLYLTKEGYDVICAKDGDEGEEFIENEDFDLIILDIMLPFKDGWTLLRKIKSKDKNIKVILTTARGEEDDRVFGLELGADDYMVKPISMRELVLRTKLRMNTEKVSSESTVHRLGDLLIREENRSVSEENVKINLTPKEYELMLFFIKNKNIVFKRNQLLDKIWGFDFLGDSRTVDTHIKNLREKIAYFNYNLKTVWGVGYKLEEN